MKNEMYSVSKKDLKITKWCLLLLKRLINSTHRGNLIFYYGGKQHITELMLQWLIRILTNTTMVFFYYCLQQHCSSFQQQVVYCYSKNWLEKTLPVTEFLIFSFVFRKNILSPKYLLLLDSFAGIDIVFDYS